MLLRIGTFMVYQCDYILYTIHELDTPNPQVTSGSNNNIRHLNFVTSITYPVSNIICTRDIMVLLYIVATYNLFTRGHMDGDSDFRVTRTPHHRRPLVADDLHFLFGARYTDRYALYCYIYRN